MLTHPKYFINFHIYFTFNLLIRKLLAKYLSLERIRLTAYRSVKQAVVEPAFLQSIELTLLTWGVRI